MCVSLLLSRATQALQEDETVGEAGIENGEPDLQCPRVRGGPRLISAGLHLMGLIGEQDSAQPNW